MPALYPGGPRRAGAIDARGVVAAGAHRRVAKADRGDCPLRRIKHLAFMADCCRVAAQHGKRLGGQVFQPWAAVDQQCLAEGSAQPMPGAQRIPATPLVTDLADPSRRLFDGIAAEDQAGQVQRVEVAQVMEAGEPAEQVGEGDKEPPHRPLGRQRPPGEELLGAGAAQPGPIPVRPGPP